MLWQNWQTSGHKSCVSDTATNSGGGGGNGSGGDLLSVREFVVLREVVV